MSDNAAPLILLTRPKAASDRFAANLRETLGQVRVVTAPLMAIQTIEGPLDLDGVTGLIFTSANGVESFASLTDARDLPAWCVGDRTAAAARDIGLRAMSAQGDADALVEMMALARPTGRLLHLHGAHTRGDVVERLCKAGLRAEGQAVYDQVTVPPPPTFAKAIGHPGPVIAPLFSPRSARIFAQALDGPPPAGLRVVALSPAVARALPGALAKTAVIADTPDAVSMIRAIQTLMPA
jgi:uroporphyrinogen-III synthase